LTLDAGAGAPFADKTVAVLHAAWHSCGSYQVNVGQLLAYKALGARTISIAIMDALSPPAPSGPRWPGYLAATGDLPADARYFAAAPTSLLWTSLLLKDGWWPLIHGDQARWLVALAERAEAPAPLPAERIDLIHANHYFTLPFAKRLAPDAPLIVETQDVQARQYMLRNQGGFFIKPYATYDDMLAVELDWTARADLCVHINAEEHAEFRRLLPDARHALIYPSTPSAPLAEKASEIVIVASDNYANYVSLRWFLTEVLPRAQGVKVSICGNIDAGVKARDARLYERHLALFRGRVADIGAVYARAAAILLPTIEGHGLSIKAVEALSCGAPLIATRLAFRGMGIDPGALRNVSLCEDAESFAAALRAAAAGLGSEPSASAESDTRRLYERVFSPQAYARALAQAAAPLIGRRSASAPECS